MVRKCASIFLTLIAIIVLNSNVYGQGFNLLGGKTLDVSSYAFRAEMGWPGFEFAFHIPILDRLELAPKLTFFYGQFTHAPIIGNGLGTELRYTFIKGTFSLAFHMDFQLIIAYHPSTVFAIQLGTPGVVGSYEIAGKHYINFGFRLPIRFVVHPNFVFGLPIMFRLGAEFNIAPNINLSLRLEAGPEILIGDGGTDVEANIIALFGFGYKF
jgi:hypothetical protein